MRTTITAATASLLTLGVVLTGCSDAENGTPEASGDTGANQGSSQDSKLPHSGAPAVTDPIDTAKWENDPCTVITAAQFSSVGLKNVEAKPDDAMAGPKCDWYPPGRGKLGGTFVTASPTSDSPEGLSTVYANNKEYGYEVWQALEPVQGHPVVAATEFDDRSKGYCAVAVGLRDDLVYDVSVTDPEKNYGKDPCATAAKIATLAVKTMKGGA